MKNKPDWWRPYNDKAKEKMVDKLVAELGETIPVEVAGKGTWAIPRHYIGLYKPDKEDIPNIAEKYNFKKIK